MFECRIKFNEKNQVVCCSQTECINCKDIDSCEELDLYIRGPYDDVSECMKERSYKRVKGKIRQKQSRR